MRGEKVLKILEAIAEAGDDMIDCGAAFLRAGYGASSRGMQYQLDKIQREKEKRRVVAAEERRAFERFRHMLYGLERDGLATKSDGRNGKWKITNKGEVEMEKLRERMKKIGATPSILDYEREESGQLVIVAFDIPEKQRTKRDWLRAVLQHLGFKMLQRSVWFGKIKIPRELPEDLRRLGLIDAVEVLAISKTGSLRQML